MANTALYVGLLLATRVVPHLPTRLAYGIADLLADVAYLGVPQARQGIEANLAVALPHVSIPERRQIARHAFRHDARNWVDTLRIPHLTSAEVTAAVDVSGWDHVVAATKSRKGAVIISFHLGNFDLVGQVLAAHGFQLTVPIERMQPDGLFRLLKQQRESHGIHLVPVDRASRALLAALKRGELVGATIDRNLSGKGIVVSMFGRPTTLARGPIALSLRTGTPLLLGFGVRVDGRYSGFVFPVTPPPGAHGPHDDEIAIAERIAELMERYIGQFPDQWLAFTPLWAGRGGANSAATIGRNTRAAI